MGRHPATPSPAGALVRAAMAKHKFTHHALADTINVNAGRLSRLLSGRSRATLAEAIALRDLLGVPVDSWPTR